MPGWRVHDELWKTYRVAGLLAASAALIAAKSMGASVEASILVGGSTVVGYGLGRLIQPDLDLIGIDRAESRLIKSVIFLPVIAWSTMYARIIQGMGGHRAFWSHFPLVSSFIRLCWFAFPIVVALHFMGLLGPDYSPVFMGLLLGLTISDTVHAVADFKDTLEKRVARRYRAERRRSCAD